MIKTHRGRQVTIARSIFNLCARVIVRQVALNPTPAFTLLPAAPLIILSLLTSPTTVPLSALVSAFLEVVPSSR